MDKQNNKVLIVGGGSWATANVKMLTDNPVEKEVFWWMRSEKAAEHIRQFKHNPNYLSSVEIKVPAQNISTNLKSLIVQADIVLLNVPAAFLKEALIGITAGDFAGKKVISAIKGIVPDENQIIGEFVNQRYNVSFNDFIV